MFQKAPASRTAPGKLKSSHSERERERERERVREGGVEMGNTLEALLPDVLGRVLFREIFLFSVPEAPSQTQSSTLTISMRCRL